MLLDVLGHVEETLQVAQRVVCFGLVDHTVEPALASSIYAALVYRELLSCRLAGWLTALIVT